MRDLDLLCQVKLTNRVIERERETKRNHYIKLQVSSSCFHFSGDTRILLFRWMLKVSEPLTEKMVLLYRRYARAGAASALPWLLIHSHSLIGGIW